jgi:cathepsin A (carboxypeptidase C)
MPNIGFGLYSGYVGVPGSNKQLHYIAAQSQNNPATDPVIVWFNGGPGCSSMLGFLQEHGPYSLADGALNFTQNDFSWNKQATVIYIESPAGVGFSYCPGDDCKVYNDNSTADDNLQAVLGVLGKFPELQKNPLFISGESYAGIYVPMLVDRID